MGVQEKTKEGNHQCMSNCQKKVYDAIEQFIGLHGFPVNNEGICVEICSKCYLTRGEHLIIRPEISVKNNLDPANIDLFITIDSIGPCGDGTFEMRLSFNDLSEN